MEDHSEDSDQSEILCELCDKNLACTRCDICDYGRICDDCWKYCEVCSEKMCHVCEFKFCHQTNCE